MLTTKKKRQIHKPCIFITSTGRTGTQFFAWALERIIPGCNAFHEPDTINTFSPKALWRKAQRFGLLQLTIGKFNSRWCMRGLSTARATGGLSRGEAAHRLYKLRAAFLRSVPQRVFAEANSRLNGLIDVLPRVFPLSKTVLLVRDGRDWVTSCMSHKGGLYSYRDLVYWLGLARLSPKMLPNDVWCEAWDNMGLFERNCWLWAAENRWALQCARQNENARIWKFEDIFLSPSRYRYFCNLLDYVTVFPGGLKVDYRRSRPMLEMKINRSKRANFPHWTLWTPRMMKQFQDICGDLMGKLGYGKEPKWQQKCAEAGVLC